MKEQKKSWLYKFTLFATGMTLLGIWTHLTTAFSAYEIKDANPEKFQWSFAGGVLASAISFFLISTAMGINKLEERIKTSTNKNHIRTMNENVKSLKRYLILFAIIEMYGNIFYSVAAHNDDPNFGGIWVAGISIFMFSFSLTLISIVGSKLLSIFAVNEDEKEDNKQENKFELTEEMKNFFIEEIRKIANIQKQPTYEPVPEQLPAIKQEAAKVTPPELSTRNRA